METNNSKNLRMNLFTDSFVHGKKRKTTTRTIVVTLVSIFSALIVALLFAAALGYDPFEVLAKLFYIGFSDTTALFSNIGVFCFAGFAFAFASKAGLFNIGISGQMLGAGTFVVFLSQWIGPGVIPQGAGQLVMLLVAMIVGGLIATIVGALDVYLRINSVVSSIIFNWVIYFVSFFLLANAIDPKLLEASGGIITNSNLIAAEFRLWDSVNGTGGIIPITILIVIFGAIIWVIFKFTVFGQKIKSVGLSMDGSKYAGYNVGLIRLSSFGISGMIAGVLAMILYTTTSIPAIGLNINVDTVPIEGFNGIAIALIGNNNPIAIIAISALFGLFQNSIPGIIIPQTYINVLLGILMLGSALVVVVYKFKPWLYLKSFKYDLDFYKSSKNFENRFDSLISKYKSISSFEKKNIFAQEGLKEEKQLVWNATEKEIYEDYHTERKDLMDSWQTMKAQMMINKNFKFDEIVAEKQQAIQNDYDAALTKHVSDLKDSIDMKNEAINSSVGKHDRWLSQSIAKMKHKQASVKNDPAKTSKAIKHIELEIEKIVDPKQKQALVNQLQDLQKGGNL